MALMLTARCSSVAARNHSSTGLAFDGDIERLVVLDAEAGDGAQQAWLPEPHGEIVAAVAVEVADLGGDQGAERFLEVVAVDLGDGQGRGVDVGDIEVAGELDGRLDQRPPVPAVEDAGRELDGGVERHEEGQLDSACGWRCGCGGRRQTSETCRAVRGYRAPRRNTVTGSRPRAPPGCPPQSRCRVRRRSL